MLSVPTLGVLIMSKANSTIAITHNEDGGIVFTVKDAGSFTFRPADASEAARTRAMVHGFIQRISDGAALSKVNGMPAPAGDKLAAMQAIADHYASGTDDWNMTRKAGGGRTFNVGAVVMGLIEAGKATDVDAANSLVDRLAAHKGIERTAAAKLWAATGEVAEAMARIASRNAPSGADDYLAELGVV